MDIVGLFIGQETTRWGWGLSTKHFYQPLPPLTFLLSLLSENRTMIRKANPASALRLGLEAEKWT